jgi:hypothetical protein
LVLGASATLLGPHTALSQPFIEPISGFAGRIYIDYPSRQVLPSLQPSGIDIYSSVGMPLADWGWSSPDRNDVQIGDWGACTAAGGLLHENDFTVYNGAASTSDVTSLTMTLQFYDEHFGNAVPGSANAPLVGSYSVDVAWPDGLHPGYYGIITVTNLDGAGIVLPASTTGSPPVPARIMELQTTSNVVGGSRVGFANNSTVTIGSSGQSLFIHDSTHPAVFELLNNPQTISNPGFRFNVCYANCDASTTSPTLNVGDFTCFLQRYAASDPYANCDGSTTAPVLNVGDFTCFLQRYAQGCS